MFKIKDRLKLELQMPETMKLFGCTEKFIDKTKNTEKVPSLEIVEVVLVQYNLVDNQYQQSLKYYTLLCLVNLMLTCSMLNQVI